MKKTVWGIVLGGIAIFAIGIFVGNGLKYNALTSIQGYLFRQATATSGNASDGNASDANYYGWIATDGNASSANYYWYSATDGNASSANYYWYPATDGNASDANYWYPATDGNASDGNATIISASDNIINLLSISFDRNSAQAGEYVYVAMGTTGAPIVDATLILSSEANGLAYSLPVHSLSTGRPYIVIPKGMSASNYKILNLLLTGKNSDGTTFTKQYSSESGINTSYFKFGNSITVNNAYEKIRLDNISFKNSKGKTGDKIYVNVTASDELVSLSLSLKSGNSEITVYIKDLSFEPYFEIPSNIGKGKYSLFKAVLSSENVTTIYTVDGASGTEKFKFNDTLEVEDVLNDKNIYNNEDITAEIIERLYDSDSKEITINVNSNTIINSEIFNIIKGTDKKLIINYKDNSLVFDGKNINAVKSINASIDVSKIKLNTTIGGLVPNGVLVSFANNGTLPGKATVRVKSTSEVDEILGTRSIYVYFFNEEHQGFVPIAEKINKTSDEYYEFEITHNSDYVLVNEKLDDSLLYKEDSADEVVAFQKGTGIYLLMIGVSLVLIIIVVVVIFVLKNKDKEKLTEEENIDITKVYSTKNEDSLKDITQQNSLGDKDDNDQNND